MSSTPLEAARLALQNGERIHARKILRSILLENPRDEQAWLLMARVVDTPSQVKDCLERALLINPHNLATARALENLLNKPPEEVAPAVAPSREAAPAQPAAVTPQAVKVPPQPAAVLAPAAQPRPVPLATARLPEQTQAMRPPKRHINWSLIIGAIIVGLVVFFSFLGPRLATGDPLEENVIIKVGDTWVKPPFTPFEVPGFPLGSDQFGRNLFSRVLYAIQPTMIMVAIVALVRLLLGTVIGMGAGWSVHRTGRILDIMITAALSVPVFMVALAVIAMLGAVGGNLLILATTLKAPDSVIIFLKATSNSTFDQILPFVLGLSINGWGETARIVREQTRAARSQLYIEAAHALGASSWRILNRHVLRQIMSMVWMLLAFEISSTMMVTAGLGFLGYYIGGDVWIEVADFVSRRVSGTPELGQMLSTSWASLTEPWPMVLTGSVIFVIILGFNLLGEGLRVRLDPERINRNSIWARTGRAVSTWTEEHLTYPTGQWLRRHSLAAVLGAVVLVLILSGSMWLRVNSFSIGGKSGEAVTVPGGHLWSGERGEPLGARSSPTVGPQQPSILWQLQDTAGWANGLAIRADGTIYLVSLQSKLMAINPDGSQLWEASLPEEPLGAPALGVNGTVYVTHRSGGLTAFDAQGQQLWHYQPVQSGKPAHGAITTEAGSIYYLLENPQQGDTLVALAEDGSLRWSTATGTKAANSALRLSPDGEELFVKNQAFSTESGELLERSLPTADDPVLGGREQLFTGGDLERYVQAGHNVMHWTVRGGDFVLLQTTEWNYESAGFNMYSSFPTDAGVTSDQKIWLFYSVQYGGTQLIWLEPAGEVIGISSMPITKNSIVASVDSQGMAYVCGLDESRSDQIQSKCLAYPRGSAEPEWEFGLPGSMAEVGAVALAQGRLYVLTKDGYFYAIGEASAAQAGATSQPASSQPQAQSATQPPPAAAGLAWSTQLPGAIGGMFSEQEDGSLLTLTTDNLLIRLDEQGQVINQVMVEPGPYHHPENRYIIQPIALENGTYLVFSNEQSAYVMDANGTKLWEVKLEANPAGLPVERGDTTYLTDLAGNLYAFGPEGLRWQVKPAGATKAVNSPTIGPDGRLYYVVVIDRKVFIQEVKPDGTTGWQAPVKTGFFTYDLLINGPGSLLFLRDDIFDTQAGVRLDLAPPFRVDEYIVGEDGLNYLRSDHVISQWELSEQGMQLTKTASWNYQKMGTRPPFMSFITDQKVIWLYYGDTLVWLDLDGNVLGTIPLENGPVQRWDLENTRYTACQQAVRSSELDCKLYTLDANGPAWEATISGLPDTQWGWTTQDGLTAVTEDGVIYHVNVDWPEP